jgi:hypothetical protein
MSNPPVFAYRHARLDDMRARLALHHEAVELAGSSPKDRRS